MRADQKKIEDRLFADEDRQLAIAAVETERLRVNAEQREATIEKVEHLISLAVDHVNDKLQGRTHRCDF
jgi:hypothetical protein